MANRLTLTTEDPSGSNNTITVEICHQLQLISDNGTTALYSMDGGTLNFSFTYVSNSAGLSVTGFEWSDGGKLQAQAVYNAPQLMSFSEWTSHSCSLDLFDELTDNAWLQAKGLKGPDIIAGYDLGDRIELARGNDAFAGFGGGDRADMGGGDDYAHGGAGSDLLLMAHGNDLVRTGTGNDTARGGTGNDVIEGGAGRNVLFGNADNDLFIFDTAKNGTQIVRDFSADDVILFGNVASTAGGDPDGDTLEDIPAGTVENFAFKETVAGHLRIDVGDQTVFLRNTRAADVMLDQLYFGTTSADDAIAAFNLGAANLGESLDGATLSKGTAGGTNFIAFGSEGSTFDAFGFSSADLITFGTETGL